MEFHSLPQPGDLPVREREDAMGAYLMMFAAIGAGLPLPVVNLIASVVYYYINRSSSRFVHFHSLQALLSQIPTSLMNIALVFWSLRIIFTDAEMNNFFIGYIWLTAIANLLYFIFGLIAAYRARKGRMYYLWMFGKIAYDKVYRIRVEHAKVIVNAPPV